ncbi:3-hydroxyacyl-CoA dehydrogenase [Botrytis cinerea]
MTFTLPTTKNRPITVLGGGVLGRRIACTWASGGWDVRIRDPSAEQRNAALHYIENNISIYASAIKYLAEAVKGAWNVIEAVPEKLQLKIDTFAELEKLCEQDALLVSNSSSYKTSEMLEKIVELMTDGETAEEVFPWYVEKLKEVGMHPIVAKRESTGFVFNRVWASIKRECLMILAEGVSTPEELDRVWVEMFGGGKGMGPCAMMDGVGLDTVAFIEEHYVKERGLPSDHTVDFLKKKYLEEGKLGAKSGKGGLYPPGQTTKVAGEEKDHHENLHAPSLHWTQFHDRYPKRRSNRGWFPDGRELRTLVSGQHLPDGLDISLKTGRIYWTCMGIPASNDGTVQSCKLDGSDIKTVIPSGAVHTPKQLIIDHVASKLYFCDREGLRVMRCNFDGSEHETIIQTGDWENPEDAKDQLKWCVGISINNKEGKFYWTQKGSSKGGKGRIFRANIQMPAGQTASTRKDIELLFQELPEPIDLEIDQDTQTLYWTDRGDPPRGNSLNSAKLGDNSLKTLKEDSEEKNEYQVLTRQLHEAIGLKLDTVNKHVYLTDLGGAVYRVGMDGKDKKRVYDEECSFTGVGLTHV